ncbi:MAG: hypothetical protein L3J42_01295, partial [Hydrogenimonas sp.]|nr:hypothetical protein [Hydrogenimonas sp.]
MNDGVVKYRVEHTKTGSIDETLFASLQPLRRRLKELGLIGVKEGVGYGNISRRLSDGNFVITATQTGHLPRLDGDGYALITDYDEDSFCIKSKGAAKP